MHKNRILVAPLNWGLGHATRCIPLIKKLLKEEFEPVIASDGAALELLRKEFPQLEHYPLPGYNIRYSKNPKYFHLKLLAQTPHILRTINAERKATQRLIAEKNISGIISDNRWGVRSKDVPSVFLTHQVRVLSGWTTSFSSRIQQSYIRKFDECWVPDLPGEVNLSGKMSHQQSFGIPLKYVGVLSRFKKEDLPLQSELIVILSGPEPQRSILEEKLIKELQVLTNPVIIVRGIMEPEQKLIRKNNLKIYNFMKSKELQFHLNSSKIVICRSGYSSVMDLVKLQKPALLIPTPGQYEQVYLAQHLQKKGWFSSCDQEDFSIEKLQEVKDGKKLFPLLPATDLAGAFALFKGK